MSSQASFRYSSTAHPRKRVHAIESYQGPARTYYTSYEPHMALSSPPRSSSPPMTPYTSRYARSDAIIRTSPEISTDALLHSAREYMEDPSLTSGTRYLSNGYPERAYTPLKHDSFSAHSYPPPSDFDVSEYSEDVDHDIPEVDSEHTSDSPPRRSSIFFSDSEEEENRGDDDFSFGHGGYRTTFFRTSAERGQWKSHPMPFKSTPLAQARKPVSTLSRQLTPLLIDSTRTNSEPLPATVNGLGSSTKPDQGDTLHGVDGPPILFEHVAEEPQPEAESPHTMPSLTSDWESIPDIDVDGHEYQPSSPLPPSSPMSYSVSILSRSVSPRSSPVMRSSSPLSEVSSLNQEERDVDVVKDVRIDYPEIKGKIRSSPTFALDDIKSGNALHDGPSIPGTILPLKSDPASLLVDAAVISDFQILQASSSSAATTQNLQHKTIVGDEVNITDVTPEATRVPSPNSSAADRLVEPAEDRSHLSDTTHAESSKSVQEIEHFSTQTKMENENNKKHTVKKKRRNENDDGDDSEHAITKKRKVDTKTGRVTSLLRSVTYSTVRNEKVRKQAEKEKGEKVSAQQVSAKLKRRGKDEVEVSVSCPASSTKRSKLHRPPLPKAPSSHSHMASAHNDCSQQAPLPSTQDPETVALNAEICGMLIETMALSRASSLALSSLYKMMMQAQPSLKSQRSEQEWLTVFAQVLHEGEAGKGCGVFGKVESSGKDDSNRPLEAQWFYVPEQDEDQERAALIRSMMPRPAKRTETKKYKQYYWRPLDKISKWDPEDEL